MRETQPSPLWGRGWAATRALTSGGGPGEGVELVKTQYPYRTLGLDPLTPTTSRTWGPLLASADENASSSHPLPQGGEGRGSR